MRMPVRYHLHLARAAACSVIAFKSAKEAFLEESIALLGSARGVELDADIERFTGARVDICL